MTWTRVRGRWVGFAVPFLLSIVLFTGALVWLGDSFGHALALSLALNIVLASLDRVRGHRRDAKRRQRQHSLGAAPIA